MLEKVNKFINRHIRPSQSFRPYFHQIVYSKKQFRKYKTVNLNYPLSGQCPFVFHYQGSKRALFSELFRTCYLSVGM
jgi:hypothetical protein